MSQYEELWIVSTLYAMSTMGIGGGAYSSDRRAALRLNAFFGAQPVAVLTFDVALIEELDRGAARAPEGAAAVLCLATAAGGDLILVTDKLADCHEHKRADQHQANVADGRRATGEAPCRIEPARQRIRGGGVLLPVVANLVENVQDEHHCAVLLARALLAGELLEELRTGDEGTAAGGAAHTAARTALAQPSLPLALWCHGCVAHAQGEFPTAHGGSHHHGLLTWDGRRHDGLSHDGLAHHRLGHHGLP